MKTIKNKIENCNKKYYTNSNLLEKITFYIEDIVNKIINIEFYFQKIINFLKKLINEKEK